MGHSSQEPFVAIILRSGHVESMQSVLSAFGFLNYGHAIQLRLFLDGNSKSGQR